MEPLVTRASAFVISITPFAPDGSFSDELVRAHLRRLRESGIGVYLGGGGSGEGYALDPGEAARLLEIGVEELKGAVPVRSMGVEPRTARQMIDYVAVARRIGVDATQIYSLDQGHGHRPSTAEIRRYFEDILSAIDLPAVISTHQSVGYQVPVDMLVALADRYDHVIGINCSHQDMGYLAAIVDALGDRLDVHVGGPAQALTAWALGATGYLCSEGNLIPKTCMRLVDAFKAGDEAATFATFGTVLRMSMSLYGAGGIRATKAVLDALGLPGGPPRLPQLSPNAATVKGLLDLVRSMDLADDLAP